MMEPMIEARGLERAYRDGTKALRGVDLSVAEGARFALLGPNGAGKSTLTRILCTLSSQDAGTAKIAGIDSRAGSTAVRARIGVALQDPQLDPEATARAQLVFQARLYGAGKAEAEERARDLSGRFGLSAFLDRKAKDLSGGNKRRLHVALALAHRPRLLFLDEPTVGMDPEIRADFWAELRRLNAEEGTTLFFTTQYLEEAERHAEDLAVIDGGRIAYRGSTAGFLAGPGRGEGLEAGYVAFLASRRDADRAAVDLREAANA